ncbi:MAG TPA: hypothetical protein VES67_11395 [Vicinamibacterales bacterium]|nr:hypothetical protein [Vicinamibacterales bacterium]
MAAGAGSRYGGPKQVAALGPTGERLFDYAVFDAVRSGFDRIVFVVRDELANEFRSIAAGLAPHIAFDPHVVVQRLDDLPHGFRTGGRAKPWGTAHAVLTAQPAIDGSFAVVNADDFYGPEAYRLAADAGRLAEARGITTVIAMRLADTLSPHGPVTRAVCAVEGSRVTGLEEVHDIARDGADLAGTHLGRRRPLTGRELVSMNFWVCPKALLPQLQAGFESFLEDHGQDATAEFRLPEAISDLADRGAAQVQAVHAPGPWFGLTHTDDRPAVVAGLREMSVRGIYPTPLWSPC